MVGSKKSVQGKSCSKSDKKKATQFKKGAFVQSPVNVKCDRKLPDTQGRDTEPTRRERPTVSEVAEALALCDNPPETLLQSLRPAETETDENTLVQIDDTTVNIDCSGDNENIIVNMGKVSDLITHVHTAACTSKSPNVETVISQRIGLCVFVQVHCRSCRYKSPEFPMSATLKPPTGPEGGALNTQLAIPVMKSKVGSADVLNVLTCLNIKNPSFTTMQRKLNKLSDIAKEDNEKQMKKSQKHIAKVKTLAGQKAETNVQFDVAFTCRPQGGSEKAAQSFGELIDQDTGLPIDASYANKHCRIKGCKHENCYKNYRSDASIAASERTLLHESLGKIETEGILSIRSITTDGGSQFPKAIRDFYTGRRQRQPVHYKCIVHKCRNLRNKIRSLRFQGLPRKYFPVAYARKLATAITTRVTNELKKIKQKKPNVDRFTALGVAAIDNILECFSGKHEHCQQVSFVCSVDNQEDYKNLPHKEPLQLNRTNLDKVKNKLNYYFKAAGLREVFPLYNTNCCESTNAAVFNYAPKSWIYTRNFPGLLHSATHSKTVGPGRSTAQLAASAGIDMSENPIMFQQLVAKDRKRDYHKTRKQSPAYKQRRYKLRKKKDNKSLFNDSVYSTENEGSSSAADHSYGLQS